MQDVALTAAHWETLGKTLDHQSSLNLEETGMGPGSPAPRHTQAHTACGVGWLHSLRCERKKTSPRELGLRGTCALGALSSRCLSCTSTKPGEGTLLSLNPSLTACSQQAWVG